jgi:hypothetical protein
MRLRLLAVTTAALLLSSCAVPISDFQYCVDLGPEGAACNNFLTQAPLTVPEPQWDQVREGEFCINASAYGNIKRELEDLCSKTECTYAQKQQVNKAISLIDRMLSRGK